MRSSAGSGWRSRRDARARTRRSTLACHRRLGHGGFGRQAAWQRRTLGLRPRRGRGDIWHSPTESRSRSGTPRDMACARSPDGWPGHRRRSRGSCAATPPRALAASNTARRRRSGHADRAARRPKPAKLAVNARLQQYVQERLDGVVIAPNGTMIPRPVVPWTGRRHGARQPRRWARAWSPEQIARRLLRDFPDDASMRISHEAIYQALYVQGRGALRRELTACLRTGRTLRVPRARTRGRGKQFVSPEILISQRPAEAADRAVPGHWEGDLILGLGSSAVGTLVERTTRYTLLLHLPPHG